VGEADADGVDEDRSPMLDTGAPIEACQPSLTHYLALNGITQDKKGHARREHADAVDGDGERVEVLIDVIGEEGDQRQREEPDQVGPENASVRTGQCADEAVVIDPVDRDVRERKAIDQQRRDDPMKRRKTAQCGHLQLQHHDGDDDGDNTVGEGFEPGWRGGGLHGVVP